MYSRSCAFISAKFTVNSLPIAFVSATTFNTSMYSLTDNGNPFIFKIKNGIISIITGTMRDINGDNKL